jgi:nitroimidazol reductase NimA-like FMN-containing flavoprotein (pyridoxamine 5'-phosphate oxidase superfamily)
MISTHDVVVTLPEEEAWEFLRTHQLGRLAYHLVREVHIVPINYAVTEGRVVFRTAPGSKLLGIVMDEDVAFEVDEVGDDEATSVVVRGRAVLLRDREADEAQALPLRSWVPTDKDEVVAIDIREISGRSFRLDRQAASSS